LIRIEDKSEEGVPLYAGARLTVDESVLAILAYCHRYSLSGEALKGLLSLIELHCPIPNECKTTLYSFRSVFDRKGARNVHMICDVCKIYIGSENVKVCPNEKCSADLSSKSKQNFFLEVSVEEQIKTLFQRKDFHSLLQHRFKREKISPDAIADMMGLFISNIQNQVVSFVILITFHFLGTQMVFHFSNLLIGVCGRFT
jgi:hypothetical protein